LLRIRTVYFITIDKESTRVELLQDSKYALASKCFVAAGQPSAAADTLIKIGKNSSNFLYFFYKFFTKLYTN
jgi:hypothetical protein